MAEFPWVVEASRSVALGAALLHGVGLARAWQVGPEAPPWLARYGGAAAGSELRAQLAWTGGLLAALAVIWPPGAFLIGAPLLELGLALARGDRPAPSLPREPSLAVTAWQALLALGLAALPASLPAPVAASLGLTGAPDRWAALCALALVGAGVAVVGARLRGAALLFPHLTEVMVGAWGGAAEDAPAPGGPAERTEPRPPAAPRAEAPSVDAARIAAAAAPVGEVDEADPEQAAARDAARRLAEAAIAAQLRALRARAGERPAEAVAEVPTVAAAPVAPSAPGAASEVPGAPPSALVAGAPGDGAGSPLGTERDRLRALIRALTEDTIRFSDPTRAELIDAALARPDGLRAAAMLAGLGDPGALPPPAEVAAAPRSPEAGQVAVEAPSAAGAVSPATEGAPEAVAAAPPEPGPAVELAAPAPLEVVVEEEPTDPGAPAPRTPPDDDLDPHVAAARALARQMAEMATEAALRKLKRGR